MVFVVPTLLTALAAALVVAAPAEDLIDRNSCRGYLDTFEEYGTVLVPQAAPVGQYHGITYQGFDAAVKGAVSGTVAGVIPHSGNDVAVASVTGALVQIGTVTLNGFGNILATPSRSFDLYSFWFGCGLDQANGQAPGVATGCTIGVSGYTKDNKVVSLASYNYAPAGTTAVAMKLATLPSTFRDLKNVTIGIATGAVVTAGTVLVIDDVSHCNY